MMIPSIVAVLMAKSRSLAGAARDSTAHRAMSLPMNGDFTFHSGAGGAVAARATRIAEAVCFSDYLATRGAARRKRGGKNMASSNNEGDGVVAACVTQASRF